MDRAWFLQQKTFSPPLAMHLRYKGRKIWHAAVVKSEVLEETPFFTTILMLLLSWKCCSYNLCLTVPFHVYKLLKVILFHGLTTLLNEPSHSHLFHSPEFHSPLPNFAQILTVLRHSAKNITWWNFSTWMNSMTHFFFLIYPSLLEDFSGATCNKEKVMAYWQGCSYSTAISSTAT